MECTFRILNRLIHGILVDYHGIHHGAILKWCSPFVWIQGDSENSGRPLDMQRHLGLAGDLS